jgi:hypothetical protein
LIEITPLSALLAAGLLPDNPANSRPLFVVEGSKGSVVTSLGDLEDALSDLVSLDGDNDLDILADNLRDLADRHGLTGNDHALVNLAADSLVVAEACIDEMQQDIGDMLHTPTGDVWKRTFQAESRLEGLRDDLDQALLYAAHLDGAAAKAFLWDAITTALVRSTEPVPVTPEED